MNAHVLFLLVLLGLGVSSARADETSSAKDPQCSEQAQAAAVYRGELWLGGFQGGLCVQRNSQFVPVESPVRFVNDLLVVNDALYVAAHEGLFVTHDGLRFSRVNALEVRGANGLASDGKLLWVSTPSVLFQLPLDTLGRYRRFTRPGGSTAIQAVARHGQTLWLATEDRGLVRITKGKIQVFDALRGLGSSWVVDVEVDKQGNAYAATLRDGLFRVSRDGEISAIDVGHRWLLRLYAQDGALWIGSQDGLAKRHATGRVQQLGPLPDARVHMLYRTDAGLWVGTEHGATLLSEGT
jgi:ligand-binding sensor domain-containing protein